MAIIAFIIAAILAGVDLARSEFKSLTGWAVILIAVTLILVGLGFIGNDLPR